ncbi:hypothetical protein [Methylobacterium sp.]|uniref:hypothetical protein n=1 Tax=Methylobacterium sp. TaxID=409 RepID=UPI000FA5C3BB|nr:hypothetical protein [Methylobacterium sp.]RUP22322.1 MAG: hypothetical protein EKK44_05450 [Methylobacterium sp.]
MPNVVANRQVAHILAHQAQDSARSHNGNFWFEGRKLYSYSTPIAHLVPGVDGELIALVTARSYSITTNGKHIGPAHSALGYGRVRKTFTVPFIGAFGGQNRGDRNLDAVSAPEIHAANLAAYFADYTATVEGLPRKRDYDRSIALAALNRIANPACDYAEAFGLPRPAYDTDADEAAAFRLWSARNTPERIAARAARAEAAAAAKAARDAETAAARVERERALREAWLSGEPTAYYHGRDERGGAYLRVRGDVLETSLGAEAPLSHAIKAFRFVKLCRERGEAWHRNGRTVRVGHFQVDSIEASGDFVAGCHRINWSEVERIAASLDLLDAEPSADAVELSHV